MKIIFVFLWILLCSGAAQAQVKYTSGHDVLLWLGNETSPIPGPPLPSARSKTGIVARAALATVNPYKIQPEDWYVGAAATAYLGVGYYDFYETFRVLENCAHCRETSPVFAGYFNGRPKRSNAALFHFAVNGAFVGGLKLTQVLTNRIEKKQGLTGWKKHTGDLIITGFLVWATWDRYNTATDNKRIADKYEK